MIFISYFYDMKNMKNANVRVSGDILDRIAHSNELSESDKLSMFRYIGYLNREEQESYAALV